MMNAQLPQETCIIVGASHGGVNLAFALRKEGYTGRIQLIDTDKRVPYHRPPLSKKHLISDEPAGQLLKPLQAYEKADIDLQLGVTVIDVDPSEKTVTLDDGSSHVYTQLVLATGTRTALVNNTPLPLTSAEFNALSLLMTRAGQTISKQDMTQEVLNRPLEAYDRAMDVHISRIRQKLSSEGINDVIKSIRGVGYQMLTEQQPSQSDD